MSIDLFLRPLTPGGFHPPQIRRSLSQKSFDGLTLLDTSGGSRKSLLAVRYCRQAHRVGETCPVDIRQTTLRAGQDRPCYSIRFLSKSDSWKLTQDKLRFLCSAHRPRSVQQRPCRNSFKTREVFLAAFYFLPWLLQFSMLSLTLVYLFSHCFHGTFESPLQSSANASPIYYQKNISVSNGMNIQCDGAKYGRNPDLADCRAALARIPVARIKLTFMDRTKELPQPQPGQNIEGLPYRVMGCKPF